jgi:hypothetical protein
LSQQFNQEEANYMDRVTTFGAFLTLLLVLLPAIATLLSGLAILFTFFPPIRPVSIISALGCLAIYAFILTPVILKHESYQHYVEVYNSLPAGKFLRSFIPLVIAIVAICLNILSSIKLRSKDD